MDAIAYFYLETPEPESVPALFTQLLTSGISVDAFGLRDPPRKWSGDANAMSQAVLSQPERNKWCFFGDRQHKVSMNLVLRYEDSWGYSTLSLGAPDEVLVSNLSRALARALNPFLAIQGHSGGGKKQNWVLVHEREDCPSDVRSILNAA